MKFNQKEDLSVNKDLPTTYEGEVISTRHKVKCSLYLRKSDLIILRQFSSKRDVSLGDAVGELLKVRQR